MKRGRLARCATLLLLGLVLAGCANPGHVRARQEAAQTGRDAEDDAQCRSNGAAPGSPAYDQCRERLAAHRAQEDAIRAQKNEAFQRTMGAGTEALSGH